MSGDRFDGMLVELVRGLWIIGAIVVGTGLLIGLVALILQLLGSGE